MSAMNESPTKVSNLITQASTQCAPLCAVAGDPQTLDASRGHISVHLNPSGCVRPRNRKDNPYSRLLPYVNAMMNGKIHSVAIAEAHLETSDVNAVRTFVMKHSLGAVEAIINAPSSASIQGSTATSKSSSTLLLRLATEQPTRIQQITPLKDATARATTAMVSGGVGCPGFLRTVLYATHSPHQDADHARCNADVGRAAQEAIDQARSLDVGHMVSIDSNAVLMAEERHTNTLTATDKHQHNVLNLLLANGYVDVTARRLGRSTMTFKNLSRIDSMWISPTMLTHVGGVEQVSCGIDVTLGHHSPDHKALYTRTVWTPDHCGNSTSMPTRPVDLDGAVFFDVREGDERMRYQQLGEDPQDEIGIQHELLKAETQYRLDTTIDMAGSTARYFQVSRLMGMINVDTLVIDAATVNDAAAREKAHADTHPSEFKALDKARDDLLSIIGNHRVDLRGVRQRAHLAWEQCDRAVTCAVRKMQHLVQSERPRPKAGSRFQDDVEIQRLQYIIDAIGPSGSIVTNLDKDLCRRIAEMHHLPTAPSNAQNEAAWTVWLCGDEHAPGTIDAAKRIVAHRSATHQQWNYDPDSNVNAATTAQDMGNTYATGSQEGVQGLQVINPAGDVEWTSDPDAVATAATDSLQDTSRDRNVGTKQSLFPATCARMMFNECHSFADPYYEHADGGRDEYERRKIDEMRRIATIMADMTNWLHANHLEESPPQQMITNSAMVGFRQRQCEPWQQWVRENVLEGQLVLQLLHTRADDIYDTINTVSPTSPDEVRDAWLQVIELPTPVEWLKALKSMHTGRSHSDRSPQHVICGGHHVQRVEHLLVEARYSFDIPDAHKRGMTSPFHKSGKAEVTAAQLRPVTSMNASCATAAKRDTNAEKNILGQTLDSQSHGGIAGRDMLGAQIALGMVVDHALCNNIPVVTNLDDSSDACDSIVVKQAGIMTRRQHGPRRVQRYKVNTMSNHARVMRIMNRTASQLIQLQAGGAQGCATTMDEWNMFNDSLMAGLRTHGSPPYNLPAVPGCESVDVRTAGYVDDLQTTEVATSASFTCKTTPTLHIPRHPEKCAMCQIDDNEPNQLCDHCDGVYHVSCLQLTTVTQGDWTCDECCAIPTPKLTMMWASIFATTGVPTHQLQLPGPGTGFPRAVMQEELLRERTMGRSSQFASVMNAFFGVSTNVLKAELAASQPGVAPTGLTMIGLSKSTGRLAIGSSRRIPTTDGFRHLGSLSTMTNACPSRDRHGPARTALMNTIRNFRGTTTLSGIRTDVAMLGMTSIAHARVLTNLRTRCGSIKELHSGIDVRMAKSLLTSLRLNPADAERHMAVITLSTTDGGMGMPASIPRLAADTALNVTRMTMDRHNDIGAAALSHAMAARRAGQGYTSVVDDQAALMNSMGIAVHRSPREPVKHAEAISEADAMDARRSGIRIGVPGMLTRVLRPAETTNQCITAKNASSTQMAEHGMAHGTKSKDDRWVHAAGLPSIGLKLGHNRKRTDEPVDIVFLDAEAISQEHTIEHDFCRGTGYVTANIDPRSVAGQQAHRDSEVLIRVTKPIETNDPTIVIGRLSTASLPSLHQGEITRTVDATSLLDDADVTRMHNMLEKCRNLLQQRHPPTADANKDCDVTVVSDGSRVTPGAVSNGPAHQVARSNGHNNPSVYAELDTVATDMAMHSAYVADVLTIVNRQSHHYVWLNMCETKLNVQGFLHNEVPSEWVLAVMRSGRNQNTTPTAHLGHMKLFALAGSNTNNTGTRTLVTGDATSRRRMSTRRVTVTEHQVTQTATRQHFNMNLDNSGPMWYPAMLPGIDNGNMLPSDALSLSLTPPIRANQIMDDARAQLREMIVMSQQTPPQMLQHRLSHMRVWHHLETSVKDLLSDHLIRPTDDIHNYVTPTLRTLRRAMAWQTARMIVPDEWLQTAHDALSCLCLNKDSGPCTMHSHDQHNMHDAADAQYRHAVETSMTTNAPDTEIATSHDPSIGVDPPPDRWVCAAAECGHAEATERMMEQHLLQCPSHRRHCRCPDQHPVAGAGFVIIDNKTANVRAAGKRSVRAHGNAEADPILGETEGMSEALHVALAVVAPTERVTAHMDNDPVVRRELQLSQKMASRRQATLPNKGTAQHLHIMLQQTSARTGGVDLSQEGAEHNMPPDVERSLSQHGNRAADYLADEASADMIANPTMTPLPSPGDLTRATGEVYCSIDGQPITRTIASTIHSRWNDAMIAIIINPTPQCELARPSPEISAAWVTVHGLADAAAAAATDRTLTSALRDVVRRERVHAVPSDPKHLMHHVSGPTTTATTNHLRTMANGPSVCSACSETIGTAPNAHRQHVHYDCEVTARARVTADLRIASIFAHDGVSCWFTPQTRTWMQQWRNKNGIAGGPMDTHDFLSPTAKLPDGYEWHNEDHTVIRHQASLDVITVAVCKWCYSVLGATSSMQQTLPAPARQNDLQVTAGMTQVLDEARQLVRHELEVAQVNVPTRHLHPATEQSVRSHLDVDYVTTATIFSATDAPMKRLPSQLAARYQSVNNVTSRCLLYMSTHEINSLPPAHGMQVVDGTPADCTSAIRNTATCASHGTPGTIVVVHTNSTSTDMNDTARQHRGHLVVHYPPLSVIVGTGGQWNDNAPSTPVETGTHSNRKRTAAHLAHLAQRSWHVSSVTRGIQPPTCPDPMAASRSSHTLSPVAVSVYYFPVHAADGSPGMIPPVTPAQMSHRAWVHAAVTPPHPTGLHRRSPTWHGPGGAQMSAGLRDQPPHGTWNPMNITALVDWDRPRLNDEQSAALATAMGIDPVVVAKWNSCRFAPALDDADSTSGHRQWPLGTAPLQASATLTAAPHRIGNGGTAESRTTMVSAMATKIIAGAHAEQLHMTSVVMQLRVKGLILSGSDIDAPNTVECSNCGVEATYCRPGPPIMGSRSRPPLMCMTCYPPDANPDTHTTAHGQVRWWPGGLKQHRNSPSRPAGPRTMTTTGAVYRWDPDSEAWSLELKQIGSVARAQIFQALPAATRHQLQQLTNFPTHMLADEPPPPTDMRQSIPDEPPTASSSARPYPPKRDADEAVSSDDSSTDEDEPTPTSNGKRRMRRHGVGTLPDTSVSRAAQTSPRTGTGKRTPAHSPLAATRQSNRRRTLSQASGPPSPRTPQQSLRPTPTLSLQSTPTRSLAVNSSGGATALTQAPAQPQTRPAGTTLWVNRGADSGWAVVTGATPVTEHYPRRYNLCSNMVTGAGSLPRQHPNTSCRGCFSIPESELVTVATTLSPPKPAPRLSKKQRSKANRRSRQIACTNPDTKPNPEPHA